MENYRGSRSLGWEKSYTTELSAQLQSFSSLYTAVFTARNPSVDSNWAVCIAPSSLFASNQLFTQLHMVLFPQTGLSVKLLLLRCLETGLSKLLQVLQWTQPSCMYSVKSFCFRSLGCLHSTVFLLLLTRLATQLQVLLLH